MNTQPLETLHREHHSLVLSLALQNSRSVDEAEDAISEAFYRIAQRIEFVAPKCERGYWARATINVLIEGFRRRNRVAFVSLSEPAPDCESGGDWDFPDCAPPIYREIERAELCAQVRRLVDELSPDHREVIEMHHFANLEIVEIAARLGVPSGTVKSRLSRARDVLGRKLEGCVL